MNTIIKTTMINCTQEDLFDFHLDTNNIKKITPTDTKVELLNEDSETYEGKVVKLKTTKFFIPTYWEVKIQTLSKPNILVDVAQKSIFKSWKHQHVFTKKGSMCELKDIIDYELPFGFLGKMIGPLIAKDINNMFDYRHVQTKILMEKR
jgi:ligand-binding SRPBCC domain-containing protein